jgi:hypothetical protein
MEMPPCYARPAPKWPGPFPACFFCATAKRLRHKADIDESFYRRIVKEMRDEGVEKLGTFYLGESFGSAWVI